GAAGDHALDAAPRLELAVGREARQALLQALHHGDGSEALEQRGPGDARDVGLEAALHLLADAEELLAGARGGLLLGRLRPAGYFPACGWAGSRGGAFSSPAAAARLRSSSSAAS